LLDTDSEGALEMIENVAGGTTHYHLAANLPNVGQISNLPLGAALRHLSSSMAQGSIPSMWARCLNRSQNFAAGRS
jgi:hypothetical protein